MLHELQQAFRRGLLEGDDGDLVRLIGRNPDEIARRMGVYRNNVHGSLTGVLGTAFPVVERLVGRRFFAAAAVAYVRRHPPAAPQLSVYGAGFPDFLAEFPPARTLGYLPDVARLEWARIEAYFAGDAACLDPATLIAADEGMSEALRFKLHPAVRLVASPYPIQRIWEANQPCHTTVAKVDLRAGGERVLVFRPAMKVMAETLPAGDFTLLSHLAAGEPLGTACNAAMGAEPQFDLQQALAGHFSRGIFIGVS